MAPQAKNLKPTKSVVIFSHIWFSGVDRRLLDQKGVKNGREGAKGGAEGVKGGGWVALFGYALTGVRYRGVSRARVLAVQVAEVAEVAVKSVNTVKILKVRLNNSPFFYTCSTAAIEKGATDRHLPPSATCTTATCHPAEIPKCAIIAGPVSPRPTPSAHTRFQLVQVIAPALHHHPALVEEPCPVVRPTQSVGHPVRELVLDDVRRESQNFVQ